MIDPAIQTYIQNEVNKRTADLQNQITALLNPVHPIAADVDGKLGFIIQAVLAGSNAGTAANYNAFAILPFAAEIDTIILSWGTKSAFAAEIHFERLKSGVASGSGDSLLADPTGAGLDYISIGNLTTVDTPVIKTGKDLSGNRSFKRGDRIGWWISSSNPGAAQNVIATLYFKPTGKGHFE